MTILGKYELIELLGEGATSEVYLARDTALDREVALKILKPSLVADSSAFERFAREAQAAAGLFHPNIATVLDMGTANGRYFIAMRYFQGKSLDKILKESGPLTWDETLCLLAQVGSALDHAHKKGFLHRDVKPGNIIRAENGEFILTDFGLTRAMMSTGLTSHTGAVLGTPAYIAPEVWLGEDATPATDQYALACVVSEALTSQVLFSGNTPPAVMTGHVLKGPQLSSVWPDGVPYGVDVVLKRALEVRSEERFISITAFIAAFDDLHANDVQPSSVHQEILNDIDKPTQTVEQSQITSHIDGFTEEPLNAEKSKKKRITKRKPHKKSILSMSDSLRNSASPVYSVTKGGAAKLLGRNVHHEIVSSLKLHNKMNLIHSQQAANQILSPIVLISFLILFWAILVAYATFTPSGDVERWSAISTIWIVIPTMVLMLPLLIFLVRVISDVRQLRKAFQLQSLSVLQACEEIQKNNQSDS